MVLFVNVFTGIVTTIWIWKNKQKKTTLSEWGTYNGCKLYPEGLKNEMWCSNSIEDFLFILTLTIILDVSSQNFVF